MTTLLILLSHRLKPLPRSKLPPSSQLKTPVKVKFSPIWNEDVFLENLVQCCSSLRTWCRRASGWCPCSSCSTTWGSWSRCRGGGGRRGPGWTPPSRWPSPFQKEFVSQILRRLLFIFTVELLGKPVLQFPATCTHRWEKWISLRKLEFLEYFSKFE